MSYHLELKNVKKNFGSTNIIRGVNLKIKKGEIHSLIGPNGAGKSTLYNLISGVYNISSGNIIFNNKNIENLPSYEIYRLGLSRSFQITNIFPKLSVFENIRCGLLWNLDYKYSITAILDSDKKINDKTNEILNKISLAGFSKEAAGLLSYADQRALEIGITIAGGAETILLDEPTAGMSKSETERATRLIRNISEDRTILIVEHDMGVVFDLSDTISVLVYGEIICSDKPINVKNNKRVKEAYLGNFGN
ncbi:MAG: Galactose/methyl galactoside import ATP-binding protein MglA [Alphaproteobacteria bacterium MarineAlpha9_Bin4]|nr:ABC transporter ATP-binding protein [Pelagibacterales bacterium]PPR26778.1 MAG: Galactose/methyl galactoside import ATP-binding protein MglA [Alphaproteobacteria bacterium MarineAlpha9_Bin4]|tara:strand:- start:1306 stop:2055 length:750 start_codon:yes stop_codon:yes gene_type:complete